MSFVHAAAQFKAVYKTVFCFMDLLYNHFHCKLTTFLTRGLFSLKQHIPFQDNIKKLCQDEATKDTAPQTVPDIEVHVLKEQLSVCM